MNLAPVPWDSAFFGFGIARVQAAALSGVKGPMLCEQARAGGFSCVYLLVDGDDASTLARAQEVGFRVVDVRVSLGCELKGKSWDVPASVRRHRPQDVPQLEEIAAEAHQGTRFFRDGRFPVERARSLYRTWLRQECAGGAEEVLVVDDQLGPAGYASLHHAGDGKATIGLLGVASRTRGRGLGGALLAGVLRASSEAGCSVVSVVTQGQSLAAQRLYQRMGFRTAGVQFWLHLWP